MKKEIPTGAIVAAIAVVVLVVAFIGYKMFGPKDVTASNITQDQIKAMDADKQKARDLRGMGGRGAHQGGRTPAETAPTGQ